MNQKYKIPLAIILVISGLLLLTVKVDRIATNLLADEGQTNGIVLTSTSNAEQSFTTNRSSISNIGFYLRPTAKHIPTGDITLTLEQLEQLDQILSTISVSSAFVDVEGITQFSPAAPINIDPASLVTASLSVSPPLDGAVRLQLRELSEEQDPSTVSLSVDNELSPRPAGFQTYSPIHPPLAIQIGSLLLLFAILLFFPLLPIYAIGAALIFTIPIAVPTDLKLLIFVTTAIALSGMFRLLKAYKVSPLPCLFGAHIFAFNTWFLLQLGSDRQLYSLVALLPLLYTLVAFRQAVPSVHRRILIVATVILIVVILFFSSFSSLVVDINNHAHPRDIFLDPVQSLDASKVPGADWSNFGAYIGLINLFAAIIGIIWKVKKYWQVAALGLIAYLLARLAPSTFFTPQHLTIITVFSLAFFAAWGLQGLREFFSLNASPALRKIITAIILLITLVALLDLWQVSATVWL